MYETCILQVYLAKANIMVNIKVQLSLPVSVSLPVSLSLSLSLSLPVSIFELEYPGPYQLIFTSPMNYNKEFLIEGFHLKVKTCMQSSLGLRMLKVILYLLGYIQDVSSQRWFLFLDTTHPPI